VFIQESKLQVGYCSCFYLNMFSVIFYLLVLLRWTKIIYCHLKKPSPIFLLINSGVSRPRFAAIVKFIQAKTGTLIRGKHDTVEATTKLLAAHQVGSLFHVWDINQAGYATLQLDSLEKVVSVGLHWMCLRG